MSKQYTRGSEWRRWELHLHTPFTKKEDRYKGGNSDEKWDGFYNTIRDYVGDGTDPLKSICAIAITDYLSIDNYIKVRKDDRLPNCVKLLLPNVELRMTPIARDSPINIHCIFSPEIANEINDRFFSKLRSVEYKDVRYDATRTQLIRFGRAYTGNSELSEKEAYDTGLEQYVITPDTLSNLFKHDPELRNNTIIAVSNNSRDGASGTKCHYSYCTGEVSQLDATRHAIYQLSDMIYSSNPNDIQYFLGEKKDDENSIKEKYGSLMPCIHGCDAHTNEKVFNPDNNRYCWIKADPTFEGLRQVLYEPKDRVRISPSYPDSKQSYHVIDHVRIDDENFDPQPIYFNDKLTCIVGGKSTGKSLLLHNMALAIDAAQVKKKEVTAKTNVKEIQQLKVYWKDEVHSDKENIFHKIIYIPQTYLNRLSDEHEETTEIDKIIQDIVLQDENALYLFKEMNGKIAMHKQLIAKTIVDFLQTFSELNSVKELKKEMGNKDSILLEIEKLSMQLKQLSGEYNVTEDEMKTYQEAAEKTQQCIDNIKNITLEREAIGSIESVLQKKDFAKKNTSRFSGKLAGAIERTQITADSHWLTERGKILEEINEVLSEYQKDLSKSHAQVEALKPKMEGKEQIRKVSDSILSEKGKLEELSQLDARLEKINELHDAQLSILIKAFETYKGFYAEYANGVNRSFATPEEDLEFEINHVFRLERFSQKLLEIINKKTKSRFSHFGLENITEENLTSSNLALLIKAILTNSSESLRLTAGHTPESALRDLLGDWYNIEYVVRMGGDSIEDMSPGKKALLLLRLLISLAESKCPILIDQPEDDLDNRSIFHELIQFIKTKKIDRQIIVATHNANIVLGGDSELVLVANQRGKNSPNKEYRFEYRGGAIENNFPVIDEEGNPCSGILNMKGIQTHICEILEGGERAFDLRRSKYRL